VKGVLHSSPESGNPENVPMPKWSVVGDGRISIAICLASPLEEDVNECYAELNVPEDW